MFFYANPFLIAAAVIPAVLLLAYVYKLDRLEREPKPLLWRLVGKGILATFAAIVTEQLGTWLCGAIFTEDTVAYNLVMYYIVVACSEEGFKYLFLKRETWNNPNFNCRFDGIVYAVFVSLGFALWENISYVLMYGLSTAMLRALTAVPGHACFGVFMGAWYGLAKVHEVNGNARFSSLARKLAFLMPALIHGTYDFITTIESSAGNWIFLAFIVVMFLIAYKVINLNAKDDYYF